MRNKDAGSTTRNIDNLIDEMIKAEVLDIAGGELSPATEELKEEIAQLISRNLMPDDLKTLLARAHGAYVGGWSVNLFSLHDLEDVNNVQESLFAYIPSAIFFASDGGDAFFFVDADGSLGSGAGAVFWIYRGAVVPNLCVPCGSDVINFLASFMRGEEVWKGPSLEEMAIATMLEALATRSDCWTGKAGARLMDILEAARRHGIKLPGVLKELLRRSNGLVFQRAGITVWGTEKIERLETPFSSGYLPLAYVMGEDRVGHCYAITLLDVPTNVPRGWPYLEGYVARLAPDQPLEAAEPLGYLPNLVIEWLD
ncbi:MAG: SMI1/KNR4 family protein [Anaerolineae bacterium]|nr:SMI1/KNR4 family protein [Anaerolineae bacterium]